MGQVRNLICTQRAAAAGMLWPAEHPGLEEGAIDDQLPAALEQIEQADLTLGSVELVLLLHCRPGHPPALGGQRITGPGEGLLLYEELLVGSLPLLLRHDRGRVHREMPFAVFLVALLACCFLCRHRLFSHRQILAFRFVLDCDQVSCTNIDAGIERRGSDKCGGILMDSLIAAAGRALAAGDPLGALKRVALRDDAPALALRGIAMAQLGDFARA